MKLPSEEWIARWIWCRGEERPKNFYLHVRKALRIVGSVQHAFIRVTADSRYILFVNGVQCARGPARCDRRWQCIDRWDITGHLRPGRNVIAALVHHYGEWTFSYMLGRGGFLAEIEVELHGGSRMRLGTDDSWRVKPAEGWERNLPRMSIQLGYPEVFDARKEITGWTDAGFDASNWERASVLGPAGMEPWPRFVPREIPAMMETPLQAKCVIDTGEVGPVSTGHYVDILRVVWNTTHGVAYLATYVWCPAETDAEIHAGSQEAIRLWLNGQLVISHLVTRDPAPDQEIVPIRLNEGWNTVLAKVVQGEGQWHFYFRIDGTGSGSLIYSPSKSKGDSEDGGAWWLIAPFESTSVEHGFETRYAPEKELDFDRHYHGKDGQEIRWILAGATKESDLPSVIMSREPRMRSQEKGFDNIDGLIGRGLPAVVYPGATYARYAVVDFGKEVTGYPMIQIDGANGGEIIDLGYAEALQTAEGQILSPASGKIGIVNADRAGVHNADRYICKAGKQSFRTFDKRTFRYLQLDLRNAKGPLVVGPVSLMFSTYPVEHGGSFECSDQVVNRIWEVGRWTVQLSMEDSYSDSPWRERAQWWGDVRLEALVNYYTFGDLLLVRQGLRQIAQSQRSDGLTMAVYPTEWPNGILPTYTLLWVISLWDYYEHSGDLSLVKELFPTAERAMRYFEGCTGPDGLLRDVPYWLFVDWTDVETKGESASVNALYHGALLAAARLADATTLHQKASDYRGRAHDVRGGFQQVLWDPATHAFRDARINGTVLSKISEQANCWAVVFDVAERDKGKEIIEALFSRTMSAVRSATPYFSFYVLNALAKTGRHRESLEYIGKHWKHMLDWGATTWWETWEPKGSLCHGWSSGPTYHLSAEVLGVKPHKPGWEEILVAPHPGDLLWARGKVPTPRGIVSVEWRASDEFVLGLETPAPALVLVPLMKRGSVQVTADQVNLAATVERLPDEQRYANVLIKEPGGYRIRST